MGAQFPGRLAGGHRAAKYIEEQTPALEERRDADLDKGWMSGAYPVYARGSYESQFREGNVSPQKIYENEDFDPYQDFSGQIDDVGVTAQKVDQDAENADYFKSDIGTSDDAGNSFRVMDTEKDGRMSSYLQEKGDWGEYSTITQGGAQNDPTRAYLDMGGKKAQYEQKSFLGFPYKVGSLE